MDRMLPLFEASTTVPRLDNGPPAVAESAYAQLTEKISSAMSAMPLTTALLVLLAFGTLAFVVVVLILSTPPTSDEPSLDAIISRSRRVGWIVMAVLFGIGGFLAVAIPIAGAAVASGVVSPDGNRRAIQHLEGGIIERILVREGQVVEQGQVLVVLENTQAEASLSELVEKMAHHLAAAARAEAYRLGADRIRPPALEAYIDPARIGRALVAQQILLDSQREREKSRQRLLESQVRELEARIAGQRALAEAQEQQNMLISQDVAVSKSLRDRGLERLSRLLEVQRLQAEIKGDMVSNLGQIASYEQTIRVTQMEFEANERQEREKINEELASVQSELALLRRRIPALLDVLERTRIVSPMAGKVMNIQVTTETGVVKPGAVILELVPLDAELVLDARVNPIDIDVVHPGMAAKVVLSAFAQRNLPQVHGTVRSVSADSLTDERTGQKYFLAKIRVDEGQLGSNLKLLPGMPADIFILTGERTAFDYLVRPFLNSLSRSFRES